MEFVRKAASDAAGAVSDAAEATATAASDAATKAAQAAADAAEATATAASDAATKAAQAAADAAGAVSDAAAAKANDVNEFGVAATVAAQAVADCIGGDITHATGECLGNSLQSLADSAEKMAGAEMLQGMVGAGGVQKMIAEQVLKKVARMPTKLLKIAEDAAGKAALGLEITKFLYTEGGAVWGEGLLNYSKGFVAPVLAQLLSQQAWSNETCRQLTEAELGARRVVPASATSELGYGGICTADVTLEAEGHFPGMATQQVNATAFSAPCSNGITLEVVAGKFTFEHTFPFVSAAGGGKSMLMRLLPKGNASVCSPVGFPVPPYGMVTPCLRLKNLKLGGAGIAGKVVLSINVPVVGMIDLPFDFTEQVLSLGAIDTCDMLQSCGTCVANAGCGWHHTAGRCTRGSPRGDNCRLAKSHCDWFFDSCPSAATVCTAKSMCGECTPAPPVGARVGITGGPKRCELGDSVGPIGSFCNGTWAFGLLPTPISTTPA